MREEKKMMALMKRTLNCVVCMLFVMSTIVVPEVGDWGAQTVHAEVDMYNSYSPPSPNVAASGTGQEIDSLLSKYFRRIDSYLKENKYGLAKNELKKVYLIDPTNPTAKNYDHLIEQAMRGQQAQRSALWDAEQNTRDRRQTRDAYDRLRDRRSDGAWRYEQQSYGTPGELEFEDFERLKALGVHKYKETVISEAEQYFRQDDYDRAIARYEDALAIDPGNLFLRELLGRVKEEREERLDDILKDEEAIEDIEFVEEVSKSAMGIEDYRKGMKGHGYAKPQVGYKPTVRPAIYDKMQIPVTADFRDVDLVSVLNFLSDYSGLNIIASNAVTTESYPITARFKELPLERALRYIIKGQGLRYRIDDDLIYVATLDEMENEELETRIYYLEKGSGVFTQFSTANMGTLGTVGGGASVSGMRTIKELIEDAVPFPPGAKVVFDDRTGALIVTNTPTNLQKIEEILYVIDEPPQQVLIESRFIEIDVEEWESFGVETNLDSRLVLDSNYDIGVDATNLLNTVPSTPRADVGGLNLNLTGLLSDPQFSVILNAVNRMEKTKTLSAPKITTVNNQTATIKVVTEEVFATRFEVSLIQQDLNGDGDLDDAGETEFVNVPQEFVSRDIGVLLQCTPSVGIDKKTITLSIVPEVSFVAQEPAKFSITRFNPESGNEFLSSSGTPDIPRFTTSTLSTTVVMESGQTAVLGGLIKESRGQVEEKTPFLGDIPFVSYFFKSTSDQIDRSNLVIFITARVISA